MMIHILYIALFLGLILLFLLFRKKSKKQYQVLEAQADSLREQLMKYSSLQFECDRLKLLIKDYQKQTIRLKREQNQSNQVISLSNEKAILEQEQQKLQEKNQKLWKQSLAIFEERELIEAQKKQIEQQAQELKGVNDKLLELDKFKEGMMGMIVHDLKNPLNTILGLSDKPEVRQASKQMLTMVMNILDIQKFESTQMNLVRANFSLYKIVNQAISEIKFLVERKNISVKAHFPISIYVHVDFEITVRILVNLLTNAIKYTPNNGEIQVQASIESDNFVRVGILDTGQGIPADKLHTIFDKFSQVDARKLGSVRSTGLGLAFCKLAVEAYGGQIGVDSELGKGSTFWFLLPKGELETHSILNIEIENNKMTLSNQAVELSEEQKQSLEPFLQQLKSLTVFEYGKVKRVLDAMSFEKDTDLQRWKQQLENAVKSCNEDKYTELINF